MYGFLTEHCSSTAIYLKPTSFYSNLAFDFCQWCYHTPSPPGSKWLLPLFPLIPHKDPKSYLSSYSIWFSPFPLVQTFIRPLLEYTQHSSSLLLASVYRPFGGFPGGASGKEPSCQCTRHKRHEFSPWAGKIPWRRAWQSSPGILPEESHGQRSLVGSQ